MAKKKLKLKSVKKIKDSIAEEKKAKKKKKTKEKKDRHIGSIILMVLITIGIIIKWNLRNKLRCCLVI